MSIAFSTSSGNEMFSITRLTSLRPRPANVSVNVSVATFENSVKLLAMSRAEIFDSAIVSEIDETIMLLRYSR